jgi:LmbE family N-acetylglucosaminyl deacetylase
MIKAFAWFVICSFSSNLNPRMKSLLNTLLSFVLLLFISHSTLLAQSGSEDIYKDIKKLGVLANVLYVAAHPDDENTRLISYLSNHLSVITTYLSLTRGDGGQNLIGPEIREMLGLIRTQELLSARGIDGGNQLFTRANDFGYSKTPAETFNIWDREAVLSDVVWAIRTTRPDVIINRFSTDTSRPNHGHHTASAILAVEAFDLASDESSFPEQLKYVDPWQTQRIFWNTSYWFYGSREAFDKADKSRMLALDIGSFDPIIGESNSEIAGRSRSMHKSQGFGSAETRGESLDYIDLLKDANGIIPKSLFDGIDISWNRVAGGREIGQKVRDLEGTFDFQAPSESIPLLLDIHRSILALPESYWKNVKRKECENLIKNCLGLFVEVRTNVFKSSPLSKIQVTLEVINRSPIDITLSSMIPSEMDTVFVLNAPLAYNIGVIKNFNITTPGRLSIPYWLEKHPTEGMYRVDDQLLRGVAADPPALTAMVSIDIFGTTFSFNTPVIYKTVDPAEGEITRPLSILPPVTVEAGSDVLVFNKGHERNIQMTLTAVQDSVIGELHLSIDQPGWKVSPEIIKWSFTKAGETNTALCTIRPPDNTSKANLIPKIITNESTYHHKITTIDYEHLPYMSIVGDATIHLQSLDIKVTPRPIAYIEGAGDDVAASLGQIGYNVVIIDPHSISASLLANYQVVILGVRAFNTIESMAFKNKILFDWVKSGGTMIVQYNVSRGLITEEIAPYPITLSRDRITEENSPVTILSPDHPALTYPNKINAADFDNWAQERGLYYPNAWDDQFTTLLEMHDTGETPTKGAVLVAPYGEGHYVYTGLSFFRHLPAGNPGPYRLLSNLISLGFKNGKS